MLSGGVPRIRSKAAERSSMPVHSRVHEKDEELEKRDNDFKPRRSRASSVQGLPFLRSRKRRIFVGVVLIALLYLVVRALPDHPLARPPDPRLSRVQLPKASNAPANPGSEPVGAPPDTTYDNEVAAKQYYDGPIRYYRLMRSLQSYSERHGGESKDRNVVFAAANLKSFANLFPIACEMGKWNKADPHFVIFGRSTLSMKEILEINGINQGDCRVLLHDSRPDFAAYSTEHRAEASVQGALKYIHETLGPQALIIDGGNSEETYLSRALKSKILDFHYALIELPKNSYESLLWIAHLDAKSLGSWSKPTVDIVINAPRYSAGSLIRLLKSLKLADYTGIKMPRLTIEMPSDVDKISKRWATSMWWPPGINPDPMRANTLNVHHRIPNAKLTSEQAALRFVESFYPTSTDDHHILILSPEVEVSPMFFQYLHYMILHYRYSTENLRTNLMGISLDVPQSSLNGADQFSPPVVAQMLPEAFASDPNIDPQSSTPFLFQAPSASASLVFGDKWATFHDFLTRRTRSSHAGKASKPSKLVTETEPAWSEYLLELMRARAWVMLHPATSFVTHHNELALIPEEFSSLFDDTNPTPSEDSDRTNALSTDEPFLLAPQPPLPREHVEVVPPDGRAPLHQILPFHGHVPALTVLPYLAHTGEVLRGETTWVRRDQYITDFRQTLGGCSSQSAAEPQAIQPLSTSDLFCELPSGE